MKNTIGNILFGLLWVGVLMPIGSANAQYGFDYCPILDHPDEPIWQAYMGYVTKSRIKGFKDVGMVEAGAGSGVFYHRSDIGEWDFRADVESIWFTGTGGVNLPGNVGVARLGMNYIARLPDGYALRLGLSPGFYSQFSGVDADHIFFPFHIHGIRALTPNLSGLVGLNFYPGFDRLVDPRVGVRWMISNYLQLDLFYPKSEIIVRPTMDWSVRAGVEIREYLEYQLKDSDDRERLMMDETRVYVGVNRAVSAEMQVMLQIGRVVNRSLDYRRFEPEKDMEDAYFVRIGVGGLL